jgi:hypothetical protein
VITAWVSAARELSYFIDESAADAFRPPTPDPVSPTRSVYRAGNASWVPDLYSASRRADTPHSRGGRSKDWVKIKTLHGRRIDDERANWNEP